jgi:dTDP-4-dehydrorhamnose reductase
MPIGFLKTMTTWLFGASSLIGYALAKQAGGDVTAFASPFNRAARKLGWPAVDVADASTMRALLCDRSAPEVVVYAHAVCTVGKCEVSPQWARAMNVTPVQWLAEQLPARTRLVYVSSDHVFGEDGAYDESSEPRPISVYGQTRLAAEQAVLQRANALVIRPGLTVGPSVDGRTGHRDWLRYRYARGLPISIIADEARSAAWSSDVADRIWQLSRNAHAGLFHLPAERMVDRVTLARRLMAQQGLPATFHVETRAQQPHPHLGRIALCTERDDPLAAPLPSVVETLPAATCPGSLWTRGSPAPAR